MEIDVYKLNETFLRLDTDPDVLKTIQERFTFDVPGARFSPLYKSQVWDGKKRLFHLNNRRLYVGLLPVLAEFADERGYTLLQHFEAPEAPPITLDVASSFVESLKIASKGVILEPRPYQIEAIQTALTKKRGVLLSATSSGKSMIIYSIIRWNRMAKKRQLIVVPSVALVEQMYSDFVDYSSVNGWDVEKNVHRLYSGQEKTNRFPVTISTWQTLQNLDESFFDDFDVVIGDECLHPESLISMADGTKRPIKDVVRGDMVMTFNEQTGVLEPKMVIKTHHNISKNEQMYSVKLSNGNTVKITGNHKVLLVSGKWVRVDTLKVGDIINSS